MDSQEPLYGDPLFVGLTRPATIWGIPYMAGVIELLATVIVFLATGNPLFLLVAVPVHAILYLVSSTDPGAFATILVWMKTAGRCRNAGFWKAASFSPLSTQKWR